MKVICFIIVAIVMFTFSGCQAGDTTYIDNETIEQSTESGKSHIDRTNLQDWGEFDNINSLMIRTSRNNDNPQYVLVNMVDFYVIRSEMHEIFIVGIDTIEKGSVKIRVDFKRGDFKDILSLISDNNKMRVIMKDDNHNRLLTGDRVQLLGVFDTKQMVIKEAEYKMIKAVE